MRRSAPDRLQARGALRVCARAGTHVIGHDGYPGHGSPRTAAPARPTRTSPGAVVTESHPPTESRPSPGQPRDVPPPPEPGGYPASVVSVEGRVARSQVPRDVAYPLEARVVSFGNRPNRLVCDRRRGEVRHAWCA